MMSLEKFGWKIGSKPHKAEVLLQELGKAVNPFYYARVNVYYWVPQHLPSY